MAPSMAYARDEHIARFGSSEITVQNLIPQMTDDKRREKKEEIQGELYNVFCKYMA